MSLQAPVKVAWFRLSPRREKRLILSSYDVITGLYFRAEHQNVSMDHTTPQGLGAEEVGE